MDCCLTISIHCLQETNMPCWNLDGQLPLSLIPTITCKHSASDSNVSRQNLIWVPAITTNCCWYLVSCTTEYLVSYTFNPTPLNQKCAGSCLKSTPTSSVPREQRVNCLAQGQNDRFLPCQLRESIQQPFSYWPNTQTTRLPAALLY